MAFDYKKEYKEFYMPKDNPSIVTVPKMNYIAVRGSGNPNDEDGEYKQGTELLDACIEDSKEKGKKGLCILAAAKKKPFLADPKFLKYKGFTVCDEAYNGIQLWYMPFGKEAEKPEFRECAKHPQIEEKGYVLYYTSQCPFNAKYVPVLEQTAKENDIPLHAIHIAGREEAQNAPTPITNYALFHDGEYITNEQMNDKKFLKLVNR